ncbi:TPA: hypothetical protein ACWLUJ_005767 [Pseudomonas aeruginosa]|nr:hypothetical protein [Pseudomonas aeruginosa]
MDIDTFNKVEQWHFNGYVAVKLWGHVRLVIVGILASLAIFLYPALVLKSNLGGGLGGLAAAFVFLGVMSLLFSGIIAGWIVNPLCGLYVLERARRKYGPTTHRKILEWVVDQKGGLYKSRLDIAELARSLGEGK